MENQEDSHLLSIYKNINSTIVRNDFPLCRIQRMVKKLLLPPPMNVKPEGKLVVLTMDHPPNSAWHNQEVTSQFPGSLRGGKEKTETNVQCSCFSGGLLKNWLVFYLNLNSNRKGAAENKREGWTSISSLITAPTPGSVWNQLHKTSNSQLLPRETKSWNRCTMFQLFKECPKDCFLSHLFWMLTEPGIVSSPGSS